MLKGQVFFYLTSDIYVYILYTLYMQVVLFFSFFSTCVLDWDCLQLKTLKMDNCGIAIRNCDRFYAALIASVQNKIKIKHCVAKIHVVSPV